MTILIKLPHVIIDTVKEAISGIQVFALRNRVEAAYSTVGLKPPTHDEFNEVFFDLLTTEKLVMQDRLVKLPSQKIADISVVSATQYDVTGFGQTYRTYAVKKTVK